MEERKSKILTQLFSLCPSPLMGGGRGWVKHIVVGLCLAVKSLITCRFEVYRDKKDVPERFLTISRLQWVTMKGREPETSCELPVQSCGY